MAKNIKSIDISDNPELRSLAEEVRRTRQPRILRSDDEDVAVVRPLAARGSRRAKSGMSDDDKVNVEALTELYSTQIQAPKLLGEDRFVEVGAKTMARDPDEAAALCI